MQTSTKNETTFAVRMPTSLGQVITASAENHGRSRSDELRLAVELYAHVAMLAEIHNPELREHLGDRHSAIVRDVEADLRSTLVKAFKQTPVDLFASLTAATT